MPPVAAGGFLFIIFGPLDELIRICKKYAYKPPVSKFALECVPKGFADPSIAVGLILDLTH